MRLVENDGVVLPQIAVVLRLCQQNAVRHQLELCLCPRAVIETNLITHIATRLTAHFLCNAARHCHGGQTAWLGTAQFAASVACHLQRNLGQLRGFAAAGFTHHHNDLMPPQCLGYLPSVARDGQIRVGESRRLAHAGSGQGDYLPQRRVMPE